MLKTVIVPVSMEVYRLLLQLQHCMISVSTYLKSRHLALDAYKRCLCVLNSMAFRRQMLGTEDKFTMPWGGGVYVQISEIYPPWHKWDPQIPPQTRTPRRNYHAFNRGCTSYWSEFATPWHKLKSILTPLTQIKTLSMYPPGHQLTLIHRGCMLIKWNSPL